MRSGLRRDIAQKVTITCAVPVVRIMPTLSDFVGYSFADNSADVPVQEIAEKFRRLRCGNLPELMKRNNFLFSEFSLGYSQPKNGKFKRVVSADWEIEFPLSTVFGASFTFKPS